MSWSHVIRRVGYWGVLALVASLVYAVTSQTILASDHIELDQVSPNAVTATASQPVRNWNHVFSSSVLNDCSKVSYSSRNDQVSAARTRTITWNTGSRRDGHYLCVRTLVDTVGNEYAYGGPLRLDLAGPTIRFETGRATIDRLQATINDYSELHEQVDAATEIADGDVSTGASFRYAMLRSSSDCSVRNLNLQTMATDLTRQSTTANKLTELTVQVPVSADDHDRYVCLKATDQFGNVSYQVSSRLDTQIERVRFQIVDAGLRITASEVLSAVRAEVTSDSCSDLASETPVAQGVTSYTAAYTADDGLICFQLSDRQANTINYSYTLDRTSPGVPEINQSDRIVVATATDTDGRADTGDNDYPKDWGIETWDSYFIDSDSDNLVTTMENACDLDSYGQRGAGETAVDTWRVYDTRSSSNRLVLSSSHSRYEAICFRATDYAGNDSYGHQELDNFESTSPVIVGKRATNDNEITLSLSSTKLRVVTWRWTTMQIGDTCDINKIPATTAPTTSNEIEVTSTDVGGFYCVEALLNDNERIYQIVEVGSSPVDDSAPTVEADWNRNALQASATDDLSGVKSTTWQWQIITDPDDAASSCQSDDTADPKITSWRRGSNTGSLGTSRNGQFICFRVSDNVGNVGYEHFEIEVVSQSTDTTRPTVNVRRSDHTVRATSTSNDLPSVPDWRYKISNDSGCNDNTFNTNDQAVGYGHTVQLVDGDDVWVCFQIADSAGNLGYGKLRVDLRGPTITVSQSGTQVTATADESSSNWIYFRTNEDPAYCVVGSDWNLGRQQTYVGRIVRGLTAGQVGQYLCFRTQDSHGNQSVAVYQISGPINPPFVGQLSISFAQSSTRLVASANRAVTTWRYLVYESAPTNCDQTNSYFDTTYAGQTNTVDINADNNRHYYCFEATAADGVKGYGSHRVNIPTGSSSPAPTPVGALRVTVSRQGNRLTATANRTISDWRYLIYESKPANCDQTNLYFTASNGQVGRDNVVDLAPADSNRYYCFEAIDTNGLKAYALYRVGRVTEASFTPTPEPTHPTTVTKPAIKVTIDRRNNQLIAVANQRIANWRYLVYAQRPNCDTTNTYFDALNAQVGEGQIAPVTEQTVGYYYCFRARTADGRVGFGLHRVTRAFVQPTTQPTPTDPTLPPPLTTAVRISVSRNRTHVVAQANQNIASWRYLVYSQSPPCNNNNVYFERVNNALVGTSNQAPWIEVSQDRYYCFRAKTADGRVGFAVHRIPAATVVRPQPTPAQPRPEQRPSQPAPQPEQPTTRPATPAQPATTTTAAPAPPATPAAVAAVADPQPATPAEDKGKDEQPQTDNPPLAVQPTTETGPPVVIDEDDDVPYAWIIGGVAAAILIVILAVWPRRRRTDDDTDDRETL